MRWAFWRRPTREPEPGLEAAEQSEAGQPHRAPPGRRDESDEPPVGGPAFSGASPQSQTLMQPATPAAAGPAPPGFVCAHGAGGTSEDVELEPLRAELVALVRAIQLGDREDIDVLRQRLDRRSSPAAGLALVGGLGVLGERLLAAAGVPPGEGPPGSPGALAAVNAGDRIVARAQPLLSELVPQADPALAGWLVRFSVGMPELADDPGGARFDDGTQTQLALATLLAQTCIDGQGTPEDIGVRFVALFAG